MQRRRVAGLIDKAQALTDLAFVDVRLHLVGARTVVHGQRIGDVPLVLQVKPIGFCLDMRRVIDNRDRRRAGLVTVDIGRKHQRAAIAGRMFRTRIQAIANRMRTAGDGR